MHCSGSKGWQGIQSGLILAQLPNKTNLSLSEPPVQQYIILQAAKSIKLQLAKRLLSSAATLEYKAQSSIAVKGIADIWF